MNKSIKTFLAVLFIALTTVSCSEDEVVAFFPGDELGELRMNFKYNGTLYNITDPITYNAANKTIDGAYSSGVNLKRITLFMPLTPTIGTHFVTDSPSDVNAYGAYFISTAGNVDMLANGGLITITTITDDYIKGTFSFSGQNGAATVEVTEGDFLADRQ